MGHDTDLCTNHVQGIAWFVTQTRNQRWTRLAMAAFMGHAVLAFWFVEKGRLNSDEGWYLYAAGRVAEGLQLHRDVLFYQPPVMPHVYGGMLEHGPGMLLGARWISMFFMVVAVGLLLSLIHI